MVGRAEDGPIDARKLGDLPLAGPGDGVGLGGTSDDMGSRRCEEEYQTENKRRRVGWWWLGTSGTGGRRVRRVASRRDQRNLPV